MSISHYLDLVYTYLNDEKTYQLLERDPTTEITRQYYLYLQTCRDRGIINDELHSKLILGEDVRSQGMYFLPKLHKNSLKLRPIVSATGGPTKKASKYIDKLLQPYMKPVETYLKNSQALLETLSTLRIPKHSLLVTLDIESLYTNISKSMVVLSM